MKMGYFDWTLSISDLCGKRVSPNFLCYMARYHVPLLQLVCIVNFAFWASHILSLTRSLVNARGSQTKRSPSAEYDPPLKKSTNTEKKRTSQSHQIRLNRFVSQKKPAICFQDVTVLRQINFSARKNHPPNEAGICKVSLR